MNDEDDEREPKRGRRAMGSLTEFLYPAPARRSVGSIIGWWEKRRLAYNVAVGSAGAFTVAYGTFVAWLPPNGGVDWPPLIAVAAYGLLANICYFLGPVVEIAVDKIFRGQVLPTGPALYRMGLTFSVGLTLLPALIITMIWVARVVGAVFF